MTPPAVLAAVHAGSLVVAALVAAFLAWRWRRAPQENRVLGVLAVALLGVHGSGLVQLPDPERLIRSAGESLGGYVFVLVGVLSFLETGAFVGLIVPGELTVLLGGFFAGQGLIGLGWLIGLVWACALAGDVTSFLLGRRLGRGFLLKHGPRVKITRERLEKVEGFFDRHGGSTILFGRWLGLVRAVGPFVAGASRLPLRRFLPFDVVGAGLWSACFCLLGYLFWQSFDRIVELARRGAFALGVVVTVTVGAVMLYRYLRVADNRARARKWLERQGRRPELASLVRMGRPVYRNAVTPLGRAAAGPARFLWQRLTPGGLGLEATTLLAAVLIGGYLFLALTAGVRDEWVFLTDGPAATLARGLRVPLGVDAAILLTALGAAQVAGGLMLGGAVTLAMRRRFGYALALVAGGALTYVAVNLAKVAERRPRPADMLVEVSGYSFPSGHAAYSIAWVALALVTARMFPRAAQRVPIVLVGVLLAVGIGLTRVYLNVHYLSDVLAGWALGGAVFSVCGLVALAVAFVRNNGAR